MALIPWALGSQIRISRELKSSYPELCFRTFVGGSEAVDRKVIPRHRQEVRRVELRCQSGLNRSARRNEEGLDDQLETYGL